MGTEVAPSLIADCLRAVRDRYASHREGRVADYIPELATADPDRFGIALATIDGTVYAAGDTDLEFTIQSISKPFVYGMALGDHGAASVLERIGVEPSGDAFNSIVMDERNNRPMNPMVNAGAIAAASLVTGATYEERLARVLTTFGTYAGRPMSIDRKVFESERSTGHRNRAIAHLELSSGMIEEPVDQHLDLYFSQCSILVTARDLALMGATLANAGVHPITGDRAVAVEDATKVLSVMATCGMYDGSGQWMYRVGLPAKSGVGGGILVVLPGQLAIATYSPRLDEHGNSARGVLACEALASELSLHLLHPLVDAGTAVRRRYTAAAVPSKRVRPAWQRAQLEAEGDSIVVFELQGDLSFSLTERVLRDVEPVLVGASHVVVDLRRVGRLDATSVALLLRLAERAEATSVDLVVSGAGDDAVSALLAAGWRRDRLVADLDGAIEAAEHDVLAIGGGPDDAGCSLGEMDILTGIGAEELVALEGAVERRTFAAGEAIVRAGESADRLYFLARGSATVVLPLGSGRGRRLRTFDAGVSFGESALFDGGRRTADVVADGPAECYELTMAAFDDLAGRHPSLHAAILRGVGASLATQVARSMDEIRTLDG